MRYVLIGIAMMVFLVVSLAGFRGDISRKPPLEVFPDMDRQPKLRPMEPNSFFKNGMSSQSLVKGTIARSQPIALADGKEVYPFEKGHVVVSGFESGTNTVETIPIPVTSQLMARGRAKYNISCVSVLLTTMFTDLLLSLYLCLDDSDHVSKTLAISFK